MWVSDRHSSHRAKDYPRHTAHGLACREVIETSTFSKNGEDSRGQAPDGYSSFLPNGRIATVILHFGRVVGPLSYEMLA